MVNHTGDLTVKMNINRNWMFWFAALGLVVYSSLFASRLIFSRIDYLRIDSYQLPLFSQPGVHANGGFAYLADGGTTNYVGFGYDITKVQRISVSDDGVDGYSYGPKLTYRWRTLFLPLSEMSNVRFVPTDVLHVKIKAR
ncbi:MAG: hypothetical protein AAGA30_06035 [Planctomycetota bacterium]